MDRAPTGRHLLVAGVFFLLLAMVHTWPLASDPAHLSRNDNGDAQLNEWIVSWIAHQLPRDPAHLFDANIFHPERRTLAFSEPLLVPALLGAPIRWLGGSPVLTYNVLVWLGFTLMALAMYWVAVAFTGDRLAGLLGGSLFAFNTHHLTRLPQLQALHAEWLPLAFLALDRLLTGTRTRDALWIGLFVVLAAYTSGYLAVFVLVGLAAALLARPEDWWGGRAPAVFGRLALAAALAAALVAPLARVYQRVGDEHGVHRTLEHVLPSTPLMYVTSAASVHYRTWSAGLYGGGADTLFPGVVAVIFAAIGLGRGRQVLADRRVRMIVTAGLVGFVLSLGPSTPLYGWLHGVFPPMRGVRVASRFGILTLLAVAMLAAWGAAALRRRFAGRRWAAPALAGAILLANVEGLHDMQFQPFHGIPPVYRILAVEGDAVVAEFPFFPPELFHENGRYMVAATAHWKPLLNGYSGFVPDSYREAAAALHEFPSTESLAFLRQRGVTHVVVHAAAYGPAILDSLASRPDFKHVSASPDGIHLYRLVPAALLGNSHGVP